MVARQRLQEEGCSVAVYDARFAKPVDTELVRGLIEKDIPILTVEDHHLIGGFGGCVLEACNTAGLPTQDIHRLGLPGPVHPHEPPRTLHPPPSSTPVMLMIDSTE